MIAIRKPCILKKERTAKEMKVVEVSPWLEFRLFRGKKILHTGKENEKGCQKGQMLKY